MRLYIPLVSVSALTVARLDSSGPVTSIAATAGSHSLGFRSFALNSLAHDFQQPLQAEWIAGSAGFVGPIFKTNGSYFGGQFDPSQVGIAMAGSGPLSLVRSGVGYFRDVVDGVAG